MALTSLFAHRSGRVISLSRLLLSASFGAVIWLDPSQPRGLETFSYAVLAAYVAWSALVMALTWWSWRLDNRLASLCHLVDVGAFGIVVLLTQGFTGPTFAFFIFILLSSSIRWSWRETAVSALALIILFGTASVSALLVAQAATDLFAVVMRGLYLLIVSALFIWFGINQGKGRPSGKLAEPALLLGEQPIAEILGMASDRLGAPRLVFAWSEGEEPWVHIMVREHGEIKRDRFAPDDFGQLVSDEAGSHAFLFDTGRRLGLRQRDDDRTRFVEFDPAIQANFATLFGLKSGLAIPIRADECEGQLFVTGTRSLCTDDIAIAGKLGRDLSKILDRSAAVAVSEEAAVRRAKASLARDLHDGVIQSLTGASLKLASIRTGLDEGEDVREELETLRRDLASEHLQVRAFIEGLRSGRGPSRKVDLSSGLSHISDELSRRWNLVCEIKERPAVEGPVWMEHDLHQMVREATANAVRHGRATRVEIEMGYEDGGIGLWITDNGEGYRQLTSEVVPEPEIDAPRSLRERTEGIGGRIELDSAPHRCRTRIWVPIHESR